MRLSVVIPVYNEIHSLDTLLNLVVGVLPEVPKEIVMVDDGSTDGTREWLEQRFGQATASVTDARAVEVMLGADRQLVVDSAASVRERDTAVAVRSSEQAPVSVKTIFHERNAGKGAALRTGFQAATGEIIIIQDADLEYDPQDWVRMWRIISEGRGDIVYGSRFYGEPHRVLYFHHLLGNKVISNAINLLCNTTLSDIEVCYKMFRREVLEGMRLTSNDFGFEVEFTIKVTRSRRRWRIYETGVSYYGRTYAEGKKINWRDGVKALWYILKYRFFDW